MDDAPRHLPRTIRVKKVLQPHPRDFLPDNEQSIQSESGSANPIIRKPTSPITSNGKSFPVCYDRMIIDFLSSFCFYFISFQRFEEFVHFKLNHINRILLELRLHCYKTAHKLLVQLCRASLINYHYK